MLLGDPALDATFSAHAPLYRDVDLSKRRVVQHTRPCILRSTSPKMRDFVRPSTSQLGSTSRKNVLLSAVPKLSRGRPLEKYGLLSSRAPVSFGRFLPNVLRGSLRGGRNPTLALWGLRRRCRFGASAAFGLRLLLQVAGGPGPAVPAPPLSGLRAPRDQLSRGFGPPRLQRRARAAKPALAAGAAGSAAPAASAALLAQGRAPGRGVGRGPGRGAC